MNTHALIAWGWGILRDAIEGFAHGAVIGTGLESVKDPAVAVATAGVSVMHTALVAGCLGAAKQSLLYLNSHPIPDLLLPKPAPAAITDGNNV